MVGDPQTSSDWRLTGRRRHRRNWRGKLVLQVEEAARIGVAKPDGIEWLSERTHWRDAVWHDIAEVAP